MKIIEAMKELKLLEKRIELNNSILGKYNSRLSISMPEFKTDEDQKAKVAESIQSNEDIVTRYLKLKSDIEYTNLMVRIEYGGKTYSLSELLTMKRKGLGFLNSTYKSLDSSKTEVAVRGIKTTESAKEVTVVKYYDEAMKMNKLREIQDMLYHMDGRLEVVNATTELMEVPVG